MITNVQVIRAVPEVVEVAKSSKNTVVRESAIEYLHLMLAHWNPTHLQKHIPILDACIQVCECSLVIQLLSLWEYFAYEFCAFCVRFAEWPVRSGLVFLSDFSS
jgi:hypothetical protein